MLSKIYKYELKNWLRKPSTYIYMLVFFGFALITMLGTGGFFDEPLKTSGNIKLLNSPHEVNYLLQFFNKFFLFLLPAIVGTTIYRDFKSRSHNIIYSYPIDKKGYLLGKLFGSLTIVLIITLSVGVAFLLGETLLGTSNPQVGNTNLLAYIQTFLVFTIPNMLMFGALVFLVIAATRNIYAGFVTVILLFLIQLIVENLFINNNYLIGLFDPFAQNAVNYETRFWNLEDKNSKTIPLLGIVLQNRIFWISLITVIFTVFFKSFRFQQDSLKLNLFKTKGKRVSKNNFQSSGKVYISKVNYKYNLKHNLKTLWTLALSEFTYVVKSPMFLVLVGFGVLTIVFILSKVTNTGNMILLPVTRIMVSGPAFFFTLIAMVITFLYTGMLVHRLKATRMNLLTDITPAPNWVFMLSKILAILKIQIVLLLTLMISGIVIQLYNGHTHIEFGLYLFHLFVVILPVLIVWSFASIFIHTLIPKLYIGLFVLILGWIAIDSSSMAGITSRLFKFNAPEQLKYNDLNGYGNGLPSFVLVQSYWMFFGLLLLIITVLLWRRGFTYSFKERLTLMKSRFKGKTALLASIFFSAFVVLGFMINEGEKKVMFSNTQQAQALNNFKKDYEKYKNVLQPKITSIKLKVNLYPKKNYFNASGTYTIVNKSNKVIDTLLIKTGFDEITDYKFDKANYVIKRDSVMEFSVHKLHKPLYPNDSMLLEFTLRNKDNSIFERNSSVLKNGSFILNDAFPRLGYFLNEDKKMPSDSTANKHNYTSIDADLLDFETTISTSSDQKAIAPGYLIKQWNEVGRNYYHYKMDKKIKLLFAFNSGVFETSKEYHKGINLEIYNHKNHKSNNDMIFNGLKSTIDYNTKYFSPYQHREARVIEFPESEGTFATTTANSIPMSETRFIINSKEMDDKIDLSFYVPAHELSHQWWGNQLVPADAYGAKMLTESLTEYTTLNIYKRFFNKEKAYGFLKFQREYYLRGRARDDNDESPLYLVNDEQTHISYGKGALSFNTLKHYLGEGKLNKILQEFLIEYQFRTDKYPTSLDLINKLKKNVPAELKYLVDDMFLKITLYDNAIIDVNIEAVNEQFNINLNIQVTKYYNKEENKAKQLSDFLEIGFYDENDELIKMEKIKVLKNKNNISITLNNRPSKIILDPNLLVIDKDIKDNIFEF